MSASICVPSSHRSSNSSFLVGTCLDTCLSCILLACSFSVVLFKSLLLLSNVFLKLRELHRVPNFVLRAGPPFNNLLSAINLSSHRILLALQVAELALPTAQKCFKLFHIHTERRCFHFFLELNATFATSQEVDLFFLSSRRTPIPGTPNHHFGPYPGLRSYKTSFLVPPAQGNAWVLHCSQLQRTTELSHFFSVSNSSILSFVSFTQICELLSSTFSFPPKTVTRAPLKLSFSSVVS